MSRIVSTEVAETMLCRLLPSIQSVYQNMAEKKKAR